MKRTVLIIATLCVTTCAAMAQAPTMQEPPKTAAGDSLFDTFSHLRLSRGDFTWSASGTLSTPTDSETGSSTFNAFTSVGYFFTDWVEAEAALAWIDNGEKSGATVSLGANRYFGEWADNVYPYVGGSLGRGFGDFDGGTLTALDVTHKLGVRHYLTPHMGVRYAAQYVTEVGDLIDFEGVFTAYVGVFLQPK
jgi:hypothetical protein